MDTITRVPEAAPPPEPLLIEGYDQENVDAFLRAVADEASRLHQAIDEARTREAHAHAVLGMHEAMVATMLEAYRDVTTRRREAAATAATIVRDAEREAAGIRHRGGYA
jgi:cell division septum initiation protein DivIVA